MIPTEVCRAFRPVVHISNSNTLKSIYYTYFYAGIRCGTILVVSLPIVQRFSLQKRKLSELWLVHNAEPNAEV